MKKNHFMFRLVGIILTQVVISFYAAKGQVLPTDHKKENKTYATIGCNVGDLNARNTPGDLNISFPYQITPTQVGGGSATMQNFYQNINHVAPRNFMLYDVLYLTVGHNSFFYTVGGGGMSKQGFASTNFNGGEGFMINAGVGYSLPFGTIKKDHERMFLINSSLNLSFNSFGIDMDPGNVITNFESRVDVLGLTAAPTYTYATGTSNSIIHTTDATNLDLRLDEKYLSLNPKISITNNPLTSNIHIGIDIAYYITLERFENLTFYQTNDDASGSHTIGSVSLNTKDLQVTYNNKEVTKVPLNFNKFYFGFTVGYNFYSSKRTHTGTIKH